MRTSVWSEDKSFSTIPIWIGTLALINVHVTIFMRRSFFICSSKRKITKIVERRERGRFLSIFYLQIKCYGLHDCMTRIQSHHFLAFLSISAPPHNLLVSFHVLPPELESREDAFSKGRMPRGRNVAGMGKDSMIIRNMGQQTTDEDKWNLRRRRKWEGYIRWDGGRTRGMNDIDGTERATSKPRKKMHR